jgi:hypothetical protein
MGVVRSGLRSHRVGPERNMFDAVKHEAAGHELAI